MTVVTFVACVPKLSGAAVAPRDTKKMFSTKVPRRRTLCSPAALERLDGSGLAQASWQHRSCGETPQEQQALVYKSLAIPMERMPP
jgi:hypothetical protein